MTESTTPYSEADIFSRMIESDQSVPPELAQHILSLNISPSDQQRVEILLEKSQNGVLTDEEQEELENLNHVADLLSLWHSKARRVLKH